MELRYDQEVDVLYVALRPSPGQTHVRDLDDHRFVVLDDADQPIAVEFLDASLGLDLTGVPQAEDIRRLIRRVIDLPALHESAARL